MYDLLLGQQRILINEIKSNFVWGQRGPMIVCMMSVCICSTFCAVKMLQTHFGSLSRILRMWFEIKVVSFNSLCPQVSGNRCKPAVVLVDFCAG